MRGAHFEISYKLTAKLTKIANPNMDARMVGPTLSSSITFGKTCGRRDR